MSCFPEEMEGARVMELHERNPGASSAGQTFVLLLTYVLGPTLLVEVREEATPA